MNMYRLFISLFFVFLLLTAAACAPTTPVKQKTPKVTLAPIAVDEEPSQDNDVMTQAELQSELMSFADRYAVVLAQAFNDFDELKPQPKARFIAIDDTAYSTSAAFTIAAGPNPEVALLDMVVLTLWGG